MCWIVCQVIINKLIYNQASGTSVTRGMAGGAELRCRLILREQELRQVKKENQSLRDRLSAAPTVVQESEEHRNKDRQITELKTLLDGSRKQSDELKRKAEQVQGVLNQQIAGLKQQLSRMETESKVAAEQAGMADVPVVTAEMKFILRGYCRG